MTGDNIGLNQNVVRKIQQDLQDEIDYIAPLDIDEVDDDFFGGSPMGQSLLADVRAGRVHVKSGLSNLHQGLTGFHDALGSASKARQDADDNAAAYARGMQEGTEAIQKPFWEDKDKDKRPDPNDGNQLFRFDRESGGKRPV